MEIKKFILGLSAGIILSGCVQSTTMIGPAITIASTGDSSEFGDLYIQAVTEVPVSLTKEQKILLEKFKKLEDEKTNPSIKNFFDKAKKFWKN